MNTEPQTPNNLPEPQKPHQMLATLVQNTGQKLAEWNGGGSKYADFLPGTLAITEKPPSLFATILLLASGAFFLVTLLWMSLAHVDQVVTGTGKVRPADKVQIINHPTGGKITELLVQSGDRVTAGQVLARLDPDVVNEEVKKLTAQAKTMAADVIRLEAEAKNLATPNFTDDLEEYPTIVATQRELFIARRAALGQKRAAAAEEVRARNSEIAQFEARIRNAARSLNLVEKQAAATKELAAKGYYPELRVLSIERDVSSQRNELEQARSGLQSAKAGLAQAQAQLQQVDSGAANEILTELNQKRTERDRLHHQLEQMLSQQNNLELRAPVDGFVESLKISNAGQSIMAGEAVMHVVPLDDAFIVETRVSNRDIGHIQVGQETTIKFHAFDYQRFGDIKGVVMLIPNDSTLDERTGEAFFTVQVKPNKSFLGREMNPRYRIQTGMTADVDLLTGRRTIMSYMLDTVLREADAAFKEN